MTGGEKKHRGSQVAQEALEAPILDGDGARVPKEEPPDDFVPAWEEARNKSKFDKSDIEIVNFNDNSHFDNNSINYPSKQSTF